MKHKYLIPSYAYKFRVNYGNGQVSSSWRVFAHCLDSFKTWNIGGSFIEYLDGDSWEWFPLEEKE